jgi:hypothetical protein
MKRTTKLLLIATLLSAGACATSTPAIAQPDYGGPRPRVTCSSDDGRRNWCDIGPTRDVRLVRQISGSPCVQDDTWGVDRRGLWVDRGCRAEFIIGRREPPPPPITVTCSSDDGRRNWCDIGRSRDREVRMARQISGSPCIQDDTWGVDQRGLWVDRGCRADFLVGRFDPLPPPVTVTCSSNDGGRNWCDIGPRGEVRLIRQISGSPCVRGQTWDIDNRGLWVDRGCRADFEAR